MPTLIHFYAEIFSYGLMIQEKLLGGNESFQSCPQAHDELNRKLDTAKKAAQQAGKRAEDIEKATFAVVAWLDELIAAYPKWLGNCAPLQVNLFGTANAGDEFFVHLNNLTAQQDEVREIFYIVLCLGFVGQYWFDTGEKGELARLKELHARQLPQAPANLPALLQEHITPQPYNSESPGPPRLPNHWPEILLRTAILIAILVPVAVLMYYLWQQPKTSPPPLPLKPEVDKRLSGYSCAQLNSEVDVKNQVLLTGRVPKAADIQRLQSEISAIPGVANVVSQVQVLQWPYCEVVELLGAHKERNQAQQLGLTIAPHDHANSYFDNEYMILDITAPNSDAYLYADYYQLDGTVVHLLPNPTDANNFKPGNTKLKIGEPNIGKRHWEIHAPFGQEMIVIMASKKPLFSAPREEAESARDYLPELRQSLVDAAADPAAFSADYFFIQTNAGKP